MKKPNLSLVHTVKRTERQVKRFALIIGLAAWAGFMVGAVWQSRNSPDFWATMVNAFILSLVVFVVGYSIVRLINYLTR